jgi:glycosyltransferase involved in cell wall biosynthesis
MIEGKKLVVVLPAYNAEKTLTKTYEDLPHEVIDEVILVDDQSKDNTVEMARSLNIHTVIQHDHNMGYGGNQKTCYRTALEHGADIVVMVHPDYQYSPRLCGAMAWMVASGEYDLVLGSRILGNIAQRGGMPWWRFVSNRLLTLFENILLGSKLSEFHTGYRAYSRKLLEALPLDANSDDFVFDNQFIAQTVYFGFNIGEISVPIRYLDDSSSISFARSVTYGFGVLGVSMEYRLTRMGVMHPGIFARAGDKPSAR